MKTQFTQKAWGILMPDGELLTMRQAGFADSDTPFVNLKREDAEVRARVKGGQAVRVTVDCTFKVGKAVKA